ncbi:parkin coregulated gene protein homolog [Copidosoma floridanum]|uniref:parkin coregulated gene protein homolog n=1 Tax=Copidosoma floridanum TaxID=29053 RepID=UPI0006C95713|nr:parkin coregulated gene protein homolog [Copidosoma floridanum]
MVKQSEFLSEIRARRQRHTPARPRIVPAFTIQALQDNTVVARPPRCDPHAERPPRGITTFRRFYDRSALPVTLESDGQKVSWKFEEFKELKELDYNLYLPLMLDGLVECKPPFPQLVDHALADMLEHGTNKVLPVLPLLVRPIKRAVDTKISRIVCRTLRVLQRLVQSDHCVGQALVPYFRQILPVLNILKDRTVHYGEEIDYSHQRGENVPDLIQETLQVLELHGGEEALANIKYVIPTYESCVKYM